MNAALAPVAAAVRGAGFCFLPGAASAVLLSADGVADWDAFAASWNGMPQDTYMADGGRYRRRRHATLSVAAGARVAVREAHQPHYQSLDYNRLNGGVARHFEPIPDAVIESATLRALIAVCAETFNALASGVSWHVEVHQFRIEANAAEPGRPTPEGVHRDGVDYVMVMLVKRHNIVQGTTTIHDAQGAQLASFTLTDPLDMTLLDDARCLHGVTPVAPLDAAAPAYRDVLVVTFRRK